MTNTEYNKLLKYLYFEGYADSYEEADYILEDMSNIERKQLMMEAEGSYGQTPKAHAAFGALIHKRDRASAKSFRWKKGGKTAAVNSAIRHSARSGGYYPEKGKKISKTH